jgi:nicotinate phosphoribosyltransferase
VTGSGAPTAGLVYKLVEVDGRPVVKRSEHKATVGGRKVAVRRHKPTGTATEEIVVSGGVPDPRPGDQLLQRSFVDGGVAAAAVPLAESRKHLREALISIPWEGLRLTAGDPAIPVIMIPTTRSTTS